MGIGIGVRPIGVIRTPHKVQDGTPIQPYSAQGAEGTVEIFPEYREALQDLGDFGRVWLIYWFDRTVSFRARVIPYRDVVERGLFATRAPNRPNPIGISAVQLIRLDLVTGIIKVQDVDMLDGTPLLDMKPYVPQFDSYPDSEIGWLEKAAGDGQLADGRFAPRDVKPPDRP